MTTRSAKKTLKSVIAVFIMTIQAACAVVTSVPPTGTSIADTSTPEATSTPTETPTPDATSTPIVTATITPTHTPDVTPTQMPEFSPPAKGMGNVIGLVLWNDQPVVNAWVRLCEDFDSWAGCTGNNYSIKADQNGFFVFQDVVPGEYLVAIDVFGSGWWQFYLDSKQSKLHKVAAGKNLILGPWNIYKLDLGVIYPRIEQHLSEERPTFKWDDYPNAAYYQVTIYTKNYYWFLENERVDTNEFIPDETMPACEYWWFVDVFNAQGTKIARSEPPPTLRDYDWFFTLIDLPTSCN